MTDYNITISVNNEGIPPLIDVVQNDSGRNIVATVVGLDLTDKTARVYVVKPSGLDVYDYAQISGDTVTVSLTQQMLAEVGNTKMQISIYDSTTEERVSSFVIWLNVQESLQDNGLINSSSEYKILDDLINSVAPAVEGAENALEDATEAVTQAETALTNATTAVNNANTATEAANSAASAATTATTNANNATSAANTAAASATSAADAANTAATEANEAVAAIGDLTPNRALLSNADGDIEASSPTTTGDAYLNAIYASSHIQPTNPLSTYIGRGNNPFAQMIAKFFSLRGDLSNVPYGNFGVQTLGTESTVGEVRLTLGNDIMQGNDKNAYGRIQIYGNNTGYTMLVPENNGATNNSLILPNKNGTLATTDDVAALEARIAALEGNA